MTRLLPLLQLKRALLLRALGYRYTDETIDVSPRQPSSTSAPDTTDLASLKRTIDACHLCELSKTRTRAVTGRGSDSPVIMFVGEYPGLAEDSSGEAFSGRSGQMLRQMIENVLFLHVNECYITYLIKCTPSQQHRKLGTYTEMCAPYLEQEIALLSPRIIVSLGSGAFDRLTGNTRPLEEVRQTLGHYGDIPVVATYAPTYLLKNPGKKRDAMQDLLFIKSLLKR